MKAVRSKRDLGKLILTHLDPFLVMGGIESRFD